MSPRLYVLIRNAENNNFWGLYGPQPKKTCIGGFANNKGAEHPAHPSRLISAFVNSFLESIISKLAAKQNSNFLASLCS